MILRFASAALLFTLFIAAPAAADDRPAGADPAGAAALFQQGREAAKQKDYATACARFSESYRLDPAPGTLLNLGDCNQRLGKIASAWQMFREAAEHLPEDDPRVPAAQKRVSELEPLLPRLVIAIKPGEPEGTRVTRDDVELGAGSLDVALPVDPGEHTIVVTAPGRLPRRFTIELLQGQSQNLEVAPGALVVDASGGSRALVYATPRGLGPVRTAGVVVVGVGVASLGVAVTTGLLLPAKQQVVLSHCDLQHFCDPTGLSAAHAGQTLATINTATWIAGGVAVAGGAALIIFGRNRTTQTTAFVAAPVPGGAAASLGGAF